eukprot:3393269-Rhodomonas_salina.1
MRYLSTALYAPYAMTLPHYTLHTLSHYCTILYVSTALYAYCTIRYVSTAPYAISVMHHDPSQYRTSTAISVPHVDMAQGVPHATAVQNHTLSQYSTIR